MTDNKINHYRSPPEPPDLNPIENLRAAMKYHIRHRVRPRTKEELVSGILQFWKTVMPEMCCNYINHLRKVVPVVIARAGKASGF